MFSTLFLGFFLLYSVAFCETIFENDAIVDVSGTNYGSSTGWVYSIPTDTPIQWGKLLYRVNVDTTNAGYAHITFMQIDNGEGSYTFNGGGSSTTSQSLRIVDSVGNTQLMVSTPTQSVQYLLNIDTGSYGEINIDTEYIYYYDTNWTCMEWYTNSNTQQIQLYENGNKVYDVIEDNGGLTFNNINSGNVESVTFSFPQNADLSIGMYTYNGISVTGQIKDVKVATTRIGCGVDNNGGNGGYTPMTSQVPGGNGGSSKGYINGISGIRLIVMIFISFFVTF